MNDDNKIIEVSEELSQRVKLRRESDISDREARRRLDDIVFQSRHYFNAWLAEHELAVQDLKDLEALGFEGLAVTVQKIQLRERARHFAAMSHEHYAVLKLAGVEDLPQCRCQYCEYSKELIAESPERMKRQEHEAALNESAP